MSIWFVVVCLVVVTVVGLIVSLKKFEWLQQRWGRAVPYTIASLSAIVLTLFSVYVPSYLSNQSELASAISLYESGHQDVYQTRQSLIATRALILKDSLEDHDYIRVMRMNGLQRPRIFLRLLGSEILLKASDPEMIETARVFESTLIKTELALGTDSLTNDQTDMCICYYGAELWKLEEVLRLYIDNLKEGGDSATFNASKQELLDRHRDLMPRIRVQGRHPWFQLGS